MHKEMKSTGKGNYTGKLKDSINTCFLYNENSNVLLSDEDMFRERRLQAILLCEHHGVH